MVYYRLVYELNTVDFKREDAKVTKAKSSETSHPCVILVYRYVDSSMVLYCTRSNSKPRHRVHAVAMGCDCDCGPRRLSVVAHPSGQGDVVQAHSGKPRARLGGEGSDVAAVPGIPGAVCSCRGRGL